MKKLMTALAGVATALFAFGAVGDVTVPPNGFESYTSGDVFDPEVQENESTYWYAASKDDGNVITNYVESGTAVPTLATGVTRPDTFVDQTNSKFLSLDTSTPLFRSVQANSQDGTFTGSTIGDSGIYLDTLVKFTAADDVFGEDALQQGVDKIAIEYVDQSTDDTITNPYTGFVIRAGYITSVEDTSVIVPRNYLADAPANFDVNAWHRLTVRTIADIGGGNVGFVVYVDQNPLAYSTEVVCGDSFSPSTAAQNFYSGTIHAVYPSAVESGATGGSEIAAASFSGTGFIDDVVFTTEPPEFIKNGEAVVVPFTVDAGVTAISVAVDGEAEPFAVDMTAENLTASLPAQTAAFTVTATVNTADGYEFVSIKVGDTTYNENPASVTGYAGGAITITTVRNNFSLFNTNGEPISGTYQTLTEALAVEGVAKIQLANDYNVADNEAEGFSTYTIGSNLKLDLNGNTITAVDKEQEALFTVNAGAILTVIDSVGGGAIAYESDYAVFYAEGEIVIGAATGDFGPKIIGPLFDIEDEPVLTIIRAKLDGVNNSSDGAFAYSTADYVDEGSDVSKELDADGFWVVAPSGDTPQPTTYTVTVTPTANATYAAVIGETAVTFTENVATVDAGSTVVITATAATGYTYTGVEATGWTPAQDGATATYTIQSIAEAAAVEIPAPTEVVIGTYTVTVTPNANATYTAAYKEGGDAITPDNDVLTVTVGQTIVITATPGSNYEYAEAPTGWTAGQNGEITIEVSAVAEIAIPAPTEKQQGGYPSYIEDETAQGKYDTWKSYVEGASETVGDGEELEDAYLLNCKPSEVEAAKAAFKFTSISYDADKKVWVTATTTSYKDREYNGTVTVKQYSDVGCTTESETGTFFKAVLQ